MADDSTDLKKAFRGIQPVGSRITVSPPPEDTDEDYLFLTSSMPTAVELIEALGFVTTTERDYQGMSSSFISYRRGTLNVILTDDGEFYQSFLAATSVAKRLNLRRKEDRIALFQAVLYARIDPAYSFHQEEEISF